MRSLLASMPSSRPRFPFAVFYYQEGETVFIVAVAHRKRFPGGWRPRVGDFR